MRLPATLLVGDVDCVIEAFFDGAELGRDDVPWLQFIDADWLARGAADRLGCAPGSRHANDVECLARVVGLAIGELARAHGEGRS